MADSNPVAPEDFELMDREDEEQILAELRGVPVDKFIYLNKKTGKNELTYAGTKWLVRKMAEEGEAIRIDGHPKVERCMIDPEWITCTVLGRRVKVNVDTRTETVLDTNIGAARGWIKQKTNSGIIPDEFFFNKTVSKSVRNCQQSLIPQDFQRKMLDTLVAMQAKGGSAQQQRPQGQQQSRQQSGPPDDHDQAPPPQKQQPQQPQKQQEQQKPPQGQQAPSANAGGEKPIEVVQQHFRAVFLAFAKTEDKPTLQKMLKALTGKTSIADLERETMTTIGPLLRKVVNGELKWTGTAIVGKDGTQIYPKPAPKQEPASTPASAPASTPPEEAMF